MAMVKSVSGGSVELIYIAFHYLSYNLLLFSSVSSWNDCYSTHERQKISPQVELVIMKSLKEVKQRVSDGFGSYRYSCLSNSMGRTFADEDCGVSSDEGEETKVVRRVELKEIIMVKKSIRTKV